MTHPVAGFLSNEDLIVADQHGIIEVYRTRNEELNLAATYADRGGRPVGIVTTRGFGSGGTNEFLVIRESGSVDVFDYQT